MKTNYLTKITAISALALGMSFAAMAQPAGWSYKMPIVVKENSGTTIYNHQLRIVVNTQALVSATEMKADGSDIRFGKDCDGNTMYNYWIDSAMNTATTVIWVKIDTLYANQTRKIFMYFGNPSATAASSIPATFWGPVSSTDSVNSGSPGGVGNSQRGFRFTPKQRILVTNFGKSEPTGTTRYVTLFDFASTNIIYQQQVFGAVPSVYTYDTISNPFWLYGGTQYVLELFQGPSDGYTFGVSSQVNAHLIYGDMRYCNSCTQNTFPTNVLGGYQYGYPDMMFYYTDTVSPAPTYALEPAMTRFGGITANASVDSVCKGNMVTLTGSGGSSYSWSNGVTNGVAFAPDSTVMYVVTGMDTNGCTAMDSIMIRVNPVPVITAMSATNDTACVNQTLDSLMASPSGGVFSGSGVAGNNFNPNTAGAGTHTITYTYTNGYGCSSVDSFSVVVNLCTGINKIQGKGNVVQLYPNPASNNVTVDMGSLKGDKTIEIYEPTGRLVATYTTDAAQKQVDVSALSSGAYYVKVLSGKSVVQVSSLVITR